MSDVEFLSEMGRIRITKFGNVYFGSRYLVMARDMKKPAMLVRVFVHLQMRSCRIHSVIHLNSVFKSIGRFNCRIVDFVGSAAGGVLGVVIVDCFIDVFRYHSALNTCISLPFDIHIA